MLQLFIEWFELTISQLNEVKGLLVTQGRHEQNHFNTPTNKAEMKGFMVRTGVALFSPRICEFLNMLAADHCE